MSPAAWSLRSLTHAGAPVPAAPAFDAELARRLGVERRQARTVAQRPRGTGWRRRASLTVLACHSPSSHGSAAPACSRWRGCAMLALICREQLACEPDSL